MPLDHSELKKKLYSRVNELPTLPVVVPKLIQLMEDSKSDLKEITRVISFDPAFASKILKVANSSYYGFPKKIGELDRAVNILGFNMVKSLALSLGVVNTLSHGHSKKFFSEKGLWYHSVAVAICSREIVSSFLKLKKKEHMFVVGLLHDMGKLVFDLYFTDLFEQAIYVVENKGTYSLAESERSVIGYDHGQVGALLLERWNFPENVILPIKNHHLADVDQNADAVDLAILRVSDALCQDFFFDSVDDIPELPLLQSDLDILGLKDSDVEKLHDYMDKHKEEVKDFFMSFYEL
jgi:putative nucleotidyltransferase with HDIG domain